ncbi:CubicO group peptidase, beta-lactamase class C family [Chryseobacterium formosense]|nr:serine hydrolase domain-containing protein [Chryseobacterium formosense]SFT75049.1 CubicO group peptidase, beta-lactamase class C family [Chryseobacterium formosense]
MKKLKAEFSLILSLTILLCLQNLSAQSIINTQKQPTRSIDSLIEKKMNDAGIIGIGAAIIIDKKLAWTNGYGYADEENKIPFKPTTIMNIASISKTFTGFCIMKAVEEGKVDLDEDINHYLPFKVINPNFPNEKITLRHLATHTSSLADRYPFYTDSTYVSNGQKPEPLGDFLKNYFVKGGKHYDRDNFINSKPGTNRDYSNIGAGLAGYIIELRTGQKLSEYSKKYIFKPLKMKNSGWNLSEINSNNHSKLYQKENNKIKSIPLYEGTTYPDGGVRTSVDELSRFFITLLNDGKYNNTRLLKKELAEEMIRFQFTQSNTPDNVKPDKLNSGIFWATKMGGTRIGHNGSDPGVRTFMLSDVKKDVAVIVFFNTSLREADEDKFFYIYEDLYKYGIKLRSGLLQN